MSKARELADNAGNIDVPKNILINGGFDVWQRATSQTASGYGSDDRWNNAHGGSTKTHSQQAFALGQTDVAGNPKYFSRTVVTSVAGAGNYTTKVQRVEDVTKTAGKTVTLTFWAKADASKDIAVELYQDFGAGGSPSAAVFLTPQTVSLTTSWAKHSLTFAVPSVSGKTLGTSGNDFLATQFWFEAGSTSNSRTNSLGQQSGTFDIARVSLCEGDVTALDDPFEERTYGEELALGQRFFQVFSGRRYFYASVSSQGDIHTLIYPVQMRATPTVVTTTNTLTNSSASSSAADADGIESYLQSALAGVVDWDYTFTFDAEL